MKRIGINYKPLRLALSHRNTVSRLLFLTLFLFSFIGGARADKPAPRRTAPTFTKDITGYGESNGGYYLIASPIGEVSPHNVDNLLSDDYDLYEFDQSIDGEEWRNYKVDDQEFSLVPGRGYLYASKEGVTLTFIGTPYDGDGVIELTKSEGAHFEGWNLVGNPFAETAYIDREFYVMNEDGSGIIAAENNTVGPMEGIFVIAGEEGESVTFITPTDDESNARSASLALNLSRGSVSPGSTRGTIDRVIVRFGEGRMLPKFQLNPNHTKVYIPMDGKDYAVVRSKGVDEMPVNFKADANGSYTLSVSTEEVSFGYLHLIDSKTGKDIDLLETPSYTFEASTTDDASRFKLVYAQDGNTKPNSLADVKRSPTRGESNVPILPSHGEEVSQPAWEDDNGGEGGDDPQPTNAELTIESFENLELITFVNNEMQMEGDGTIQVEEGAQVMLSIIANVGYVIKTLMVNGENHADDIGDDFTYTFEMPDEGVTISATAEFTPDPNKLYFDTEGSGWEMGDRDNVGFYVFRPGVEFIYGWGSKKLQGTKVEGQDGIWEFDPTKASLNLEQDTQYQIIFVRVSNNNWGDQAYPLVMGTDCLGSIANCNGTTYEDPVDNSKESLAAFWKEIDASVYGPIIQITSTGNVVGTCYFEGSNGLSILRDFLNDADKIATAREKSGKSDQEIVDNIGTDLGLTKQDVYDAIADTGSDIDWDYNVSTLPGDVVVHFSNDGDIYTIHDAEGWEIFCNFIEGGESFSGKTVELGTNIEVSRCAGSGTDQEHAMNEHPFCGTFDGDGKTLTFNYGSSGTPANEDYIAPFRFVNGATIQHLHVSGDIYTQHTHSAGIVGLAYGTSNITDCRSSVNIHSSINGDGTHGGIMSCSWTSSTTNIEGCLFDGSIQSVGENVTTHSCGGFVGWKNATINVTNSLLAADLSTIGVGTGDYPSATFVRNGSAGTNCYYTRALGTEQGTKAFAVNKGYTEKVTPDYATSGIKLHDGYMECDGIWYAPAGTSLTVGYVDEHGDAQSHAATVLGGSTSTDTNELSGGWYVAGGDISYSAWVRFDNDTQLILADGGKMNVAVSKNDGLTCTDKTLTIYGQTAGTGELHTNSPSASSLRAKSLIVNGGIITANGQFAITINGGNMTVNQGNVTANGQITLNNQSSLTMNGGSLSTPNGKYIWGDASVIFNGGVFNVGSVKVTNVTLNYTSPDDRFKTKFSYPNNTTVTVADGKAFTDGTNIYSGTLTDDEIFAIRNKTLRPCLLLANADDNSDVIAQGVTLCNGEKQIAVALQGRTLYKDGAWNTLCLPFKVENFTGTPLEGAIVKTLGNSEACNTGFNASTSTLNLEFLDANEIEAGVPYIVKWTSGSNIENPVFSGVTVDNEDPADHATVSSDRYVEFVGTYSPEGIYETGDEKHNLYLGTSTKDGNKVSTLYYPTQEGFKVNACRAYFKLNGITAGEASQESQVRAIVMNFGDGGESTGIVEITDPTPDPSPAGAGSWYSLDGRRLSGKPTTKGVYINNGRKVVIK